MAEGVAHATVIEPGRGGLAGALAECWRHRELLFFLAWRDISVRYKQTLLGISWAVLQPVVTMLVFTLIFNRMAGIESGEIPYPVFCFAGLLPWLLFQNALTQSSASIVTESRLLTKVYFPRLLVPLAAVMASLVDFSISFVLLAVMMLYYGMSLGGTLIMLPLFVGMALLSALSMGLWFAALNAKYRDFRYVVPFAVRIWMFLSPVAYPAAELLEKIPQNWRWLYNLNPMIGVIEGFRWALLGGTNPGLGVVATSTALVLLLLFGGLLFFRRMERTFADFL